MRISRMPLGHGRSLRNKRGVGLKDGIARCVVPHTTATAKPDDHVAERESSRRQLPANACSDATISVACLIEPRASG